MNLSELVQVGKFEEFSFQVEAEHIASQIGSGSLRVLATPVMIGMMERTSHQLLAKVLPEGASSVGVKVEVSHLAPSPIGSMIRVRSEVLSLEGRSVVFKVEAWDDVEKVGEGLHYRIVIDIERFLKRVAAKGSMGSPS